MNIAVVTQLFAPERSAASNRMRRYVDALQESCDLTFICQIPNYPDGLILEKYKGKILCKEQSGKATVYRTWVVPSDNSKTIKRSLNYSTFFLSSIIAGLFKLKKPDIIIGSSPQLLSALAAWVLSVIKRATFVFEVRDIWPESILALGLMKKGLLYRTLFGVEKFLYRKAFRIITVNEGLKKLIVNKGVKENKIEVVPNVIKTNENPQKMYEKIVDIPEGNCMVLYAGNHSKAQNMKIIMDAVLASKDKPVTFVFVGHGEEKSYMKEIAQKRDLKNVLFIDPVNIDVLEKYYAQADVCLAALHSHNVFYYATPTKVLEYMAYGKPVIFIGDNYFAQKIESIHAGIACSPSCIESFPNLVIELWRDAKEREVMGENAKKYIKTHHNPENFKMSLERIITQRGYA